MKNILNFLSFGKFMMSQNFIVFIAISCIFVTSCQKDITNLPNKAKRVEAILPVALNEAKVFFESTRTNSFAGSSIRLNPLWDDAYLDTTLSGKKYLIVSLFGSGFKINHKPSDARLMFYKDSAGIVRSQIFAYSPTAEYKERKQGVLEIEDFCGTIFFYELDGRLKKAPHYKNGRVVAYGTESRGTSPRSCSSVYMEFDCEGCAWWVTICIDNTGGSGGGNDGGGDPWNSNGGGPGNNGGNNGGSGGTGGTGGTGGGGAGGSGGGGGGNNDNGCPTCMPAGEEPNPPIPPVVNIINQLTECRAAVFATLQNKLTGDFAQFLNNFQANTNGLSLKIKEGYLQGTDINNDAQTIPLPGGKSWEITLNRNVLDFSSKEYIAITIYHEVLHAYLEAYFPTIGTFDPNTQHHQYMANQCVDYMAAMLQQLFPNLSNTDATALSWQGLNGNFKFKNGVVEPNSYWNQLPEATRINYINRNNQFKTGKLNGTGTQCN